VARQREAVGAGHIRGVARRYHPRDVILGSIFWGFVLVMGAAIAVSRGDVASAVVFGAIIALFSMISLLRSRRI
jgi:hypothetical protein